MAAALEADPLTEVVGTVLDAKGNPVAGAAVTTLTGQSAVTRTDGGFTITGVPTVSGAITIEASATIAGVVLRGLSTSVLPVKSGTTHVGVITLGGVLSIAAGGYHTCAVLSNGPIKCWGGNWSGQFGNGTYASSSVPVAVVGITTAVGVVAGDEHTCALLADRTVQCWGENRSGQLGDGTYTDSTTPVNVTGVSNVLNISAGDSHTCAVLADSTLKCWGHNYYGQLGNGVFTPSYSYGIATPVTVTGITNVIAVSAGDYHTCALLGDGTMQCWGYNYYGQLGNGTFSRDFPYYGVPTPSTVTTISNAVSISAGGYHTCAVLDDASIQCWGYNDYGQLGNGTVTYGGIATPTPVVGIADAVAVSAGGYHTCASLADTTLKCWGANWDGELGNGTYSHSPLPVAVNGISSVVGMTAGRYHTCALLKESIVKCWGYNYDGQLGGSSFLSSAAPLTVIGVSPVTALASGYSHTCALLADGTVQCWGGNWDGQLGNGTTDESYIPVTVNDVTASGLTAGDYHTCALLADGTVQCWGGNWNGQLGNGVFSDSSIPVAVSDISNAVAVTAGNYHSCALLSDGRVQCWGYNYYGQLGNGAATQSWPYGVATPVYVTGISSAIAVSAGYSHTCALLADGTIKCWGVNWDGQLGNGSFNDSYTPVLVEGISNAIAIATGVDNTCAILSSGEVRCWGENWAGQLGNGDSSGTESATPVAVVGISTATAIAAGYSHTCAMLADHTLQCWGYNDEGQLGNDTVDDSNVPVTVRGISNAISISAGGEHTCAVLADATAKCWGYNDEGQLGNQPIYDSPVPLLVNGLYAPSPPRDQGKYTNAHSLTWSWDTSSDLNTYQIEIGTRPVLADVFSGVVGDVGSYTLVTGVLDNTDYFARVRGSADGGLTWEVWSPWSDGIHTDFTVPTIVKPTAIQINETTLQISANAYDIGSGIADYHLQISTDGTFETGMIFNGSMGVDGIYTFTSSSPGINYFIRARATDLAGNKSSYSEVLATLPPTPPTITNYPLAPTVTTLSAPVVTLQGTRGDNTSIWRDSEQLVPIGSGDWTANVPLAQGDSDVVIYAKDSIGAPSSSVTARFYVDSIAPVIGTITPAHDTFTQTAPADIQVLFTETGSGLDIVNSTLSVTRNGADNPVPGNWLEEPGLLRFTPASPLGEGEYAVALRVQDRVGLSSSMFYAAFTIDRTAPPAPILDSVPPVTGRAYQLVSGTKEAYSAIWLNGVEVVGHTENTTWAYNISLAEGDNHLSFTSKDRAGNESSITSASINYDTIPPGAITSITVQAEGDGISLLLDWHTYDEATNGNDIGRYIIYAHTSPFTSTSQANVLGTVPAGTKSFKATRLTRNQTYYLAVVAEDTQGNALSTVTPVSATPKDVEPPQPISNLRVEAYGSGLVVNWNPSANTAGDLASYKLYLDEDAGISISATVNRYEIADLTPAKLYTIKVTALDGDGNESAAVTATQTTLLANPKNIVVTPYSNYVDIVWEAVLPSDYLNHYAVYVATAPFTTVAGMTPRLTVNKNTTTTKLAGLATDTTYYFAVTAIDVSGGENKVVVPVSATTQKDTTGPVISNVKFGNQALSDGATLTQAGTLTLAAADDSGVSRVALAVDGVPVTQDVNGTGNYSFYWDVASVSDGAHTLTFTAYDTLDNAASVTRTVNVALAPPSAPVITEPASGVSVNRTSISVAGSAARGTSVQFYNHGVPFGAPVAVSASGAFSGNLSLENGENRLQAAALNRGGPSALSNTVIVTVDSTIPTAPAGLSAQARAGGQVRLAWTASTTTGVTGYDLYRATAPFTDLAQAVKANTNLITGTSFDDLPGADGGYYYRAVARNKLNTASEPSNLVSADADATLPKALSIAYESSGAVDSATQRYAPGHITFTVTVSEPLLTTPFVSMTPQGGVPITPTLTKVSDTAYQGSFDVTDATPSGPAYAVFSARDAVGNRGTEIVAGEVIQLDTDGPAVTRITLTPADPIKNDPTTPVTVTALLELSEALKSGTTPALAYQLSGAGRASIAIDSVQQTDATHWQAQFTLPADAGLNDVESVAFTYQGQDDLGNISTTIQGPNHVQVYQGALPPLATPTGLTAQALPGGQVQLTWNAVEGAADYLLYRQAPGETELTPYQHSGQQTTYTDSPATPGLYRYAVASMRLHNGEEAHSSPSAPVEVNSDAEAPGAPRALALQLLGSGIEARWQVPAGTSETLTYNLYRTAQTTVTTLAGLTRVKQGIKALVAVDSTPSATESTYVVTAVDSAGNESAASNAAYLNVQLLPVASLTVTRDADGKPVISWTHHSSTIAGYNVYLGPDSTRVKLNSGLLTALNYTDVTYAGEESLYTVTAVDSNGVESIGRSVLLPKLHATLTAGTPIKRGVFNRLTYQVVNAGASALTNVQLKVTLAGRVHPSASFNLAAGESRAIPVVVGGYAELVSPSALTTTLELTPHEGEVVRLTQTQNVDISEGALLAGILSEDLTRGATGKVRLTLENTGDVEMEIVTALNNQASNEIRFKVLDTDGNVLAAQPLKQLLGGAVVTLAGGQTVARLGAGQTFTSDPVDVPVPASAPAQISLRLEIDRVHYHLGQPEAATLQGVSTARSVPLTDTQYYGAVDGISPAFSFGDQPIVISGHAVERATQQPMANVPLKLVLRANGFERGFEVMADGAGQYRYSFTPLAGEAGVYQVSALHPASIDRPAHGEFTISRVLVSPTLYKLSTVRHYDQPINIGVSAAQGSSATNLRFAYDAADQPLGAFPSGLQVTLGNPVTLAPQQSGQLTLTVRADDTAEASGSLILKIVSDESAPKSLGSVRVDYRLSQAVPTLTFTPNFVETGVTHNGSVSETVTLENRGLAEMQNVTLQLLKDDGSLPPSWVYLTTPSTLGTLAVGAKQLVNITAAPGSTVAEGSYAFKLRVTSDNHPTTDINLFVAVTQSGIGHVLFHAADIYTATLDKNGVPVPGLAGARIKLQNELVLSVERTVTTDAQGEALVNDLPAGRYRFRASAPNHQDASGRLVIKPGITAAQDIFLDYNLVTVEWSVTEITLEDRYEITLNATYETQVPAPVVVIEPGGINLPAMAAGDVYYGEFTVTNYGLVRADNVQLHLPPSDEYVRYEFMQGLPDTLAAKQRVTVGYRAIQLKPFEPPADSGSTTGGGCGTYQNCLRVTYTYDCANGEVRSGATSFCAFRSYGQCTGGPGGGGGGGGGGGFTGGFGGGSGGAPSATRLPGASCVPTPDCPSGTCCGKAPGTSGGQ